MRGKSIVVGCGRDRTYGTDGTHGTCAAARICVAAIALVLGLAGVGLAAQPTVGRLVPEAALVGGVDGKLLHVDANDTWWFELTAELKGDSYRIPGGTRFMLLPSATLERLIADVNDRYTPEYRLAAQATRYQGANYLLVTYFLPLSKFKGDEKTEGPGLKTEGGTGGLPADPALAIPPEIVEKLKNQRPVRGPLTKPGTPDREPKPATQDYLGRMLVDKVGLIEAGDVGALERTSVEALPNARIYASTLLRFYFVSYALGWNVSNIRYELLPCGVLEHALQMQRSSMEPMRFNVTGLVTQFRGRQYLLLRRAVPVYNYGNFGR